jgi:hypothetical protein
MEVNRKSRVMNILADPDMRDVLAWYGLPIDDRAYLRGSLENFCAAFDVDVEDVLVELSLAEVESDDDDDDESWLAYG